MEQNEFSIGERAWYTGADQEEDMDVRILAITSTHATIIPISNERHNPMDVPLGELVPFPSPKKETNEQDD